MRDRRRGRVPALVATMLVAGASLAGCSSAVGGSGGDSGYVSGTGEIRALPVSERQTPGPVQGTSLDGRHAALGDYRGKIVVLNVWGSWCTDCREEAPMLAAAARDLGKRGVAFLGIDTRDPNPSAGRGYVRTFHIPYDSIFDQGGRTLLAFAGTLPPNSIPSTVIIDAQGRVAAIVLGRVDRSTLYGLVHDVRTGTSGGAA
jgi:thiol-disulfide isomerase/thioredoxin